jgi:hypothetical protein
LSVVDFRSTVQMRSSAAEYLVTASSGAGAGLPQRCRRSVKISTGWRLPHSSARNARVNTSSAA